MAGPIAQTSTPEADLAKWTQEFNNFMNSMKEVWMEWDHIKYALAKQCGNNFTLYDTALKEQARKPKFKEFVRKLDEYGEKYRELTRLCRITQEAPDTSESWTWMFKDSIAPVNGKPGHKYHIPTRHKHFMEIGK